MSHKIERDISEDLKRFSSPSPHDGRLSLTYIWEFITRTKRLPENVDLQSVYTAIRDRIRDAEKEVRLHALRVLSNLIPITKTNLLDRYMLALVPEIICNIESPSLALKTGAIDSLRIYLQYTKKYDQILSEFLNSDTDSRAIVTSIPFFISRKTNHTRLTEILEFLFNISKSECINHELALKSLSRIKYIIGDCTFVQLLGEIKTTEYRKMCDTLGLPTELKDMDEVEREKINWAEHDLVEDRVILETEITLNSGPAITMQIHEESRPNSVMAMQESEEHDNRNDIGVMRVLDDSESDFYESARRTPRKVRFGGEIVKMRTPESDSNQENEETDENGDHISSIHITLSDNISIKTKKSLIPVRVTSLPSTPKKSKQGLKKRHKSSPNLFDSNKNINSKIPLRYTKITKTNISIKEKDPSTVKIDKTTEKKPMPVGNKSATNTDNKENIPKSLTKETEKPKDTLKVPQTSSRRNSRQEDDNPSPIKVHNEIELFHNLTRSPERSRKSSISEEIIQPTSKKKEKEFNDILNMELKNLNQENKNWSKSKEKSSPSKWQSRESPTRLESNWVQKDQNDNWPTVSKGSEDGYSSFRVCPQGHQQSLHKSLQFSNLHGEEEIWAKSEALDNLIFALEQPNTCYSLEAGPAALLFEALFACQHRDRLHGKADVALETMITGVKKEVLEHCMGRLAPNLSRMGAPRGVKLALLIMNKCNARRFQTEVIERGYGHRTREGALQILMASARLLPSFDIEVYKSAQFATIALRDRRRKTRHAALELLATLAQLRSNVDILDIIEKNLTGCTDLEELMRVVRTRLSRRQLPIIEPDGNVKYSSPREQVEVEWISGAPLNVSTESSSGSSATSVNYWRHNLRHKNGPVTDLMITRAKQNDESLSSSQDNSQLWAVDSSFLSNINQVNNNGKVPPNILRPVYVLQPDSNVGVSGIRGHRRYDRGRSFSPPKPQQRFVNGSHESLSASAIHNSAGSVNTLNKQYDGFRKSFSSEQLYKPTKAAHEPYSFSLSSRSSTTSTGSSTRSGIWQKDFRSGIPIPINTDRIKIRTNGNHSYGPVVAKRNVFNSNTDSPVICRIQPPISRSSPQLVPPKSSGSESSGYFTPPTVQNQAFVKLDTEESGEPDMEPDTDFVDGRNEVNNIQGNISTSDLSDQNEYENCQHVLGEKIENQLKDELTISRQTLEDLEKLDNEPINYEKRNKSKSVVELQTFLPEITNSGRKSVSSAPPLNDEIDYIRPVSVLSKNFDDTPISPAKVNLPGALEFKDDPPISEEPSTSASKAVSSSRLSKRFARTQSRRSFRSTPRTPALADDNCQTRPYSKPKEALQQALGQMDGPEWEVNVQGLHNLVRVIKYHPDHIEHNIHAVCCGLAKHVKNLRSQVARQACQASTDLFRLCKRGLDVELEEIAVPLLQRTADTNKFLRADANASLDVMAVELPLGRVVQVLTGKGCVHQNAVVRAASSRILCDIVGKQGCDKILHLPKEIKDRILIAASNSLADGSLEARKYAKSMFSILMRNPNFQRHLYDAVPQHRLRHIAKALNNIKSTIDSNI